MQVGETRANLDALTGIRFIAAAYVVLYHSKFTDLLSKHGYRSLSNFTSHGMFAVQLFFMLSGFILAYTYSGKLGTPRALPRFWEARVARVWPLYFLSLIASSIFNHTTPHVLGALATLFMVQSWNPLDLGTGAYWNFVCWTLSCEAFFYLLFPFLQRGLQRRSNRALGLCLSTALIISAAGCIGQISYATAHFLFGLPLALIRLPDFIIGVCTGNLFLRIQRREKAGCMSWIGLLGASFCLAQSNRALLSLTVVFLAALIFGLATEQSFLRSFLSSKALLVGGAASYAMYLFQWPIKEMVKEVCDWLNVLSSVNARFALYLVALIGLSCLLYFLVEEPTRKWIRNGFGLKRPRPLVH